MKHKPGQPCECEQCQGMHKLWHDAAEDERERQAWADGVREEKRLLVKPTNHILANEEESPEETKALVKVNQGYGQLASTKRIKHGITRKDRELSEQTKALVEHTNFEVSQWFDERAAMHGGAISAEEESGQLIKQIEAENAGADVEIKQMRAGSIMDEIKRFQVSVKRPELADKSDEEQS